MKPHDYYRQKALEFGATEATVSTTPQSGLVMLHVKGLDVQARMSLENSLNILEGPRVQVQVFEIYW